jgi:hypothetical protein
VDPVPDECIHGLEAGLCDICFPKARPEPIVVSTAPRTRTPRSSAPTRPTASKPDHRVGEQRIYHVTHVNNLPFIADSGALLANASPAMDASSPANREARRETPLGDAVVSDYVPFYLSPNAALWAAMRAGTPDDRLSRDVQGLPPGEFAILVSTVDSTTAFEVAIADGDAANSFTRFAATDEARDRMLRKLRVDDEAILGAELLVRGSFPFERITLIGAANDRGRDAIRDGLNDSVHVPKIAIYPPWFARS